MRDISSRGVGLDPFRLLRRRDDKSAVVGREAHARGEEVQDLGAGSVNGRIDVDDHEDARYLWRAMLGL